MCAIRWETGRKSHTCHYEVGKIQFGAASFLLGACRREVSGRYVHSSRYAGFHKGQTGARREQFHIQRSCIPAVHRLAGGNIQRRDRAQLQPFPLGGSGKIRYYLAGAYERENGTQLESYWERISARLNVDYAVNKAVTVGTRIYFARTGRRLWIRKTIWRTILCCTKDGRNCSGR